MGKGYSVYLSIIVYTIAKYFRESTLICKPTNSSEEAPPTFLQREIRITNEIFS